MGIFTRFSDIVNSNINAILDKAEDPEKIVRLMIQEMEDTLVEVRSAAARSIADKKDLNRKLEALDREKNDWDAKAELAMRKGREDLAKAALVEKSRVAQAIDVLKEDYVAVDEGLTKLNEDIARLEAKLEDAKARQKALLARHKNHQRHPAQSLDAGAALQVLLDEFVKLPSIHIVGNREKRFNGIYDFKITDDRPLRGAGVLRSGTDESFLGL